MSKYIRDFSSISSSKEATLYSPTLIDVHDGASDRIMMEDVDADNTELCVKGDLLSDLYITLKEPPVTTERWYFKKTIDCSVGYEFTIDFTCGGNAHSEMRFGPEGTMMFEFGALYCKKDPWYPYDVYNETGWVDESFRDITLSSAASGDLKTYLEANAVRVTANKFVINTDDGIKLASCVSGETFEHWQASANNVDFGYGVAEIVHNYDLGKDILIWDGGWTLRDMNGNYVAKTDIVSVGGIYKFDRQPS